MNYISYSCSSHQGMRIGKQYSEATNHFLSGKGY